MTLYAGKKAQVRQFLEGYDGEQLEDADADVTITIWDLDDSVLVNEAAMAYSATIVFDDGSIGGWYYVWQTPPGAPGAYLARCTAIGAGIDSEEFKTIRVRRSKAPV